MKQDREAERKENEQGKGGKRIKELGNKADTRPIVAKSYESSLIYQNVLGGHLRGFWEKPDGPTYRRTNRWTD